MPRMCKFPITGQPNVISVNPLLVCYLRPTFDNRTSIHFDDTHTTIVDEPLDKVEEALNVALNSDHQ